MNRSIAFYLVCAAAVVFAYLRLTMDIQSEVHREDIFKDLAHLFVGGLFGSGFRQNENWIYVYHEYGWVEWLHNRSWLYLGLGLMMTVLEVVAFLIHKP